MPQTSLGLLAAGLASGLILSWPSDLAAPQAQRLAQAAGPRHAGACEPRRQTGDGRCRIDAPAPGGSAGEAFDDVPVIDDLGGCTPFVAIDGERELDFDTEHGQVVETATPSEGPGRGGAPSATRVGTFSTDDRTSQVVVKLGGVRREYTLIIPAEGTECILALGAPHAVNLERSWFGQVADGPDLDPPIYERTAAPRIHREHGPRRHDARPARSLRLEPLSRSSSL